MKITVNIEADNPESAAAHIGLIAQMVRMGTGGADGYNLEDGTTWNVVVEDDEWPHGDYNDAEGNLLHISNDRVIHVTWANKGAEIEHVDVSADEWMDKHGTLTIISSHSHGEEEGK